MYVIAIALAIYITARRWAAVGGERSLVYNVALWAVPAGIIGGRIYFDLTTPFDMPHHWWGPLAVWDGGLGIWGGVALAAAVGAWRVRRAGASVGVFMNAVALFGLLPSVHRAAGAGHGTPAGAFGDANPAAGKLPGVPVPCCTARRAGPAWVLPLPGVMALAGAGRWSRAGSSQVAQVLGVAQEFQPAPQDAVVGGLAGVAGDRCQLGGAVDGDRQVDLFRGPAGEGGCELGVEDLGDRLGDGPGDHGQVLAAGCRQGRRSGLAVVGVAGDAAFVEDQ